MKHLTDFHGPNAGYVEDLYERYRRDPAGVDPETRAFFEQWRPDDEPEATGAPVTAPPSRDVLRAVKGLTELVIGIREYGHLGARVDPLGGDPPGDPALDPATHGVRVSDLAELPPDLVDSPAASGARHALEAVLALRRVYSGTTGYDYDHVQVAEERRWLQEAAESGRFREGIDDSARRALLERLTEVESFERYLHQRFPGQKRFSIEGADVLAPMLDEIIQLAVEAGVNEIVMGMAHRGRLSVLAHILGKPYSAVLAEFHDPNATAGAPPWEGTDTGWTGDVKYHLGARLAYETENNQRVPITMAPNPSHLEFVNPVVEGMARAAQERRDAGGPPRHDEKAALAVLMHGDAAFPGEGVVAETLNLSRLPGYRTGGTIHIIVNNQIGFTTDPHEARSTLYASDLAKGFEIPIVHVNADDPEACIAAARLAHAYRERFHKDFLIDLVGYRRWGHNEGDEPSFTQPTLYARIMEHPTARERWANELIRLGIVTAEEVEELGRRCLETLEAAHASAEKAQGEPPRRGNGLGGLLSTAVPANTLRRLNEELLRFPDGFTLHPRLERVMERRAAAIEQEGAIDWAHAETLAFASILADGTPIRLTGQDTERGTFSQRHLALHDQVTGQKDVPLQRLPSARASFAVHNSPLTENATVGFEYGYSVSSPETLVLWEAQFGDFVNVAQVIIDQFIVSARAKWRQYPALVMLLPHGYEGQGPEHSSARLERFIQLAANDNIRIVNCTTAGQYFHVLRRQAATLAHERQPLMIMTPKSLLRHPLATSPLHELASGQFQPVLDDPLARQRQHAISRVVLCSGKVGIDLLASEVRKNADHVAVARVEELYPFPMEEITEQIRRYPALREVVWVQEEPRNMGAWRYMAPRLRALVGAEIPVSYIGRARRASPAEGSSAAHAVEQARIIEAAFWGAGEPILIEEHRVRHAG